MKLTSFVHWIQLMYTALFSDCVQQSTVTGTPCAGKTSITLNSEHNVVQVIAMPAIQI